MVAALLIVIGAYLGTVREGVLFSVLALGAAYVFWMRSWNSFRLARAYSKEKRKLKKGELDAMRELQNVEEYFEERNAPKKRENSGPGTIAVGGKDRAN